MTKNVTNLVQDKNLQIQEALWPIKQDKVKDRQAEIQHNKLVKIKDKGKILTSAREKWHLVQGTIGMTVDSSPEPMEDKRQQNNVLYSVQTFFGNDSRTKTLSDEGRLRECVASTLAQKQIIKEGGKWCHRDTWYCRNSFRNEGRTIEVYIWLNIMDYFLNFSKIWILLKEKNIALSGRIFSEYRCNT